MRVALSLCLSMMILVPARAAADIEPGSLLIYYGWPSSINGTFSVPLAAADLGQYDVVVLGDGLSESTHPDHQNTVDILARPEMASTMVFGYVDLGVSTQNLPLIEIQSRVDHWKAMGADGIFLDDFGYDFQTPRARQNAAVQYAHAQGMPVVANAFFPADAFGADLDATYNPTGQPTALNAGDFYLFESHQIRLSQYESAAAWQAKAQALDGFQTQIGFGILSVTTSGIDDVDTYDEDQFFYAWYSALLFGHLATGWGEFGFSAAGSSNAQAPYRTRPAVDAGAAFAGAVTTDGDHWSRLTDAGLVYVDTATHQYGFATGTAVAGPTSPSVTLGTPWPNPFNPRLTVAFETARAVLARVSVTDSRGRRLRILAEGRLEAGRHEFLWDGRDASGAHAASGVYLVVLETDGSRQTRKATLLR